MMTEQELVQRMGVVVDDVTPDVHALVDGGLAAGRGEVRRKRRLAVGGVAASVALVVGLGVAVDRGTDLLGAERTPPATGVEQSDGLAAVTPRGLAAALESLVPLEPYAAYGYVVEGAALDEPGADFSEPATLAMLEYQVGASAGFINATVTTDAAGVELICEDPDVTCTERVAADGDRAVVARTRPEPGYGAPLDAVLVFRADEAVMVTSFAFGTKDFVSPISISDLMGIATDPRISLRVDPQWNQAGELMEQFDEGSSAEIFADVAPDGV